MAADQSGLSGHEFAAEHGLKPQRLYRWRRRLDRAVGAPRTFEEVRVARAAVVVDDDRTVDPRFEIELRSGRVVRVSPSFDETALRRLLAIVDGEGDAC